MANMFHSEVSSFDLKEISSILHQVATALQDPQNTHGVLTPNRVKLILGRTQEQHMISTEFSRFDNFCQRSRRHFRWYMAPETLLGSWNTEKSHVWSLACIAAEMFLGSPFYMAYSDYEMIWNIGYTHGFFPDHLLNAAFKTKEFFSKTETNQWFLKNPKECRKKIRPDARFFSWDDFRKHLHKSGTCSETEQNNLELFIDLFRSMLCLDPAARISIQQLLQHPFVTGNRDLPRITLPQQPPPQSNDGTPEVPQKAQVKRPESSVECSNRGQKRKRSDSDSESSSPMKKSLISEEDFPERVNSSEEPQSSVKRRNRRWKRKRVLHKESEKNALSLTSQNHHYERFNHGQQVPLISFFF
ncbi:homeodomain-interacting protein kinase 2-like [Oryzias melastigma]|uniref:homeodomain-interacting protein kinase 2-like n=1 Tax=Oryzias melastigma TaxID=30732 RepID=UPI00168D5EA9|nr:homeodomain-interacting protein kinase 2-like [Oryzias melastigma]